jgi:hypothetical protein
MRTPSSVLAVAIAISFLALAAQADPGDHKVARLRHEIIALDASLITDLSEAEVNIANDVELLHAGIVAAQLETVHTRAAYLEAKSLIDDLDSLRKRAIADLALPPDYTPPDVSVTALGDASTNAESMQSPSISPNLDPLLVKTDQDIREFFQRGVRVREEQMLDITKQIEVLLANSEQFSNETSEARLAELKDKVNMMTSEFEQVQKIESEVLRGLSVTITRMTLKPSWHP